ncbi:hypothetical protein F2P81_003403 [Scophthalmus maximus]|uniref:A-kinase anchor protein 6 n=1 Tax=Scophthalmus maximus TaxID=52904 RepID=A0A6A4TGC1_SCOMX|nr:hypothetical protein F2P81_003403 [Scophthalmus maximus]
MSVVALSPVAPEPLSPMATSVTPVTPTVDHGRDLDLEHRSQDGGSSPGPGPSRGGGALLSRDPARRSQKPPPLHTGADWKVVLHLPEIETWLRATGDRVTQLTHSAGQDADNRHVDVHLVQLKILIDDFGILDIKRLIIIEEESKGGLHTAAPKPLMSAGDEAVLRSELTPRMDWSQLEAPLDDICEDISDHVEQIHALLETEFSLKLLSYSVNIIVDIRSKLVHKSFTRLDALTEVDDCGQLTIRCSQDYFSLDCGITAFELSDYSPGDEPEARDAESDEQDAAWEPEPDRAQSPHPDLRSAESEGPRRSNHGLRNSLPELTAPADVTNHNRPPPPSSPTVQCGTPGHSEGAKRPLQGVSRSIEASPTQPSLPKRAALYSDGGASGEEDSRGGLGKAGPLPALQFQAELSRSTPSLMDPPDRSKFWLELDSVYPENVSQSYESLQVMNGRNLQRNLSSSRHGGRSEGHVRRPLADQRSSSVAGLNPGAPLLLRHPASPSQDETSRQMERTTRETHSLSEGDSDSSLPSPMREQQLLSSDPESDPQPRPGKTAVWIVKRRGQKQEAQPSPGPSPDRQHWYGSEEFLALPAQLRKTEMLAMKLESLAQSIPRRPGNSDQDALQDVDDWDLTEPNAADWDNVGESADDDPSPPPLLPPYRRNPVGRFSPASSSDIAPSVGESIESGPLSELQSEEDEGRGSASRDRQQAAPLVDGRGGASLVVQQLLEDIQSRDKDPDVWGKIEHLDTVLSTLTSSSFRVHVT